MNTRSIFVSLIGRPNVGKSSLMNYFVGAKASIVTPKPQTTRSRITGILTRGPVQYAFFDTPGLHHPRNRLGRHMLQAAQNSVADGDVTVMLFEPAGALRPAETEMLEGLKGGPPAVAVINKADTLDDLRVIAARQDALREYGVFDAFFVVSALNGDGCDALLEALGKYAAPGPHFFEGDMYTDQPEKQLAAEMVREKLLLFLHEEIPHGTAVEVERFSERPDGKLVEIDATIYCEKKSHKGMVIGKGGAMLKKIATAARQDIEQALGTRVHLQCWVKVRDGWRDDEKMLGKLGFGK